MNLNNFEQDFNGKILNFLSNDASRIENAFMFCPILIVGPIQAIAIVMLLLKMVDLSILSGLILLIVLIPLQIVLGKLTNIFK